MILNLIDIVVKDFVYRQNPDGSYIFGTNGNFLREDRNAIIDTFLSILKKIYANIVTINKINPGKTECNVYLLDKALARYSRDILANCAF